jgi:triacylglycerol lipase
MATRLDNFFAMKRTYQWLTGLLFSTVISCSVSPPPPVKPAVPRVVLVHGFLETGSTYRTLKKRLEKCGYECLVPRLINTDGRGGLTFLATHLKQDIDAKFGPEAPISIVAFSMGGLVSREYLQNLGGAKRCSQLITVSSPHHGTKAAWLYPSQGVVEMRPGSRFLAHLHTTQDRLGKMPVTSYRTPLDLVILPPTSSIWDRADNLEYPVILHPMMLTSRPVLDDIERRLDSSKRNGM